MTNVLQNSSESSVSFDRQTLNQSGKINEYAEYFVDKSRCKISWHSLFQNFQDGMTWLNTNYWESVSETLHENILFIFYTVHGKHWQTTTDTVLFIPTHHSLAF